MRIVIAEDSVLLRDGLTRMLTDAGDKVVAAVPDADQLLRSVAEHKHLPQARPSAHRHRPPPGSGRAQVPRHVSHPAGHRIRR